MSRYHLLLPHLPALYVLGSLFLATVTACSSDHPATGMVAKAEADVDNERTVNRRPPDQNADEQQTNIADGIELSDSRPVDIHVKGPSSLAFHPQRGTVFVASDEGYVIELDLRLQQLSRHEIEGDLEGVAVDGPTGNLLLASEHEGAILEYAIDAKRVVRTMVVDFESHPALKGKKGGNHGLEGVAVVPGSGSARRLLAVVQSDPARLVELCPVTEGIDQLDKKMKKRIQDRIDSGARLLGSVERWVVASVVDLEMGPLSDVVYDAARQSLIVISSKYGLAVVCTLDGAERYRFPLPGSKPEGLALLPDGDVLVADDRAGLWRVPRKQ